MTVTSIKQSKKLLELGLNPDSADVSWLYVEGLKEMVLHINGKQPTENYLKRMQDRGIKEPMVPAWSLSALLELIPNFEFWTNSDKKYSICSGYRQSNEYDNTFDAVYDLMCQLLEH